MSAMVSDPNPLDESGQDHACHHWCRGAVRQKERTGEETRAEEACQMHSCHLMAGAARIDDAAPKIDRLVLHRRPTWQECQIVSVWSDLTSSGGLSILHGNTVLQRQAP
jgi:hypothetical protein